ncbi:MAG: hypothetical protein ACI9VS_003676 [Candidatus Binatia bacterium]|jgi:hypothetical protein
MNCLPPHRLSGGNSRLLRLASPFLAALLLIACKPTDSRPGAPKPNASNVAPHPSSIPAGNRQPADLTAPERVFFQYAVYFLSQTEHQPIALLESELAQLPNAPGKVAELSENPTGVELFARLESNVADNYSPIDLIGLQHFGRGVSREQAQSLQTSKQALIFNFAAPFEKRWLALRGATEIMESYAKKVDGLIWDEETREIFSPATWHELRLSEWTNEIPDINQHVTIHAYKNGEHIRAITLGMQKAGLPDLVIEQFPWSQNGSVGNLINLASQALAEGQQLQNEREFDLDIRAIKHAALRATHLESLKPNGKAVAQLALLAAEPEEGDPDNHIAELSFERYRGVDEFARQEEAISSLFGWEDPVDRIKHNEKILAASERAREQLPALRGAFNQGLEPGEFIQLKAPFATPDGGREFMWVEVSEWKNDAIKGLLKNQPRDIPDLQAGQVVKIDEAEVFDFLRQFPDDRREGNETGKIISESLNK